MVDGAALEKRSPHLAERGFESHPLRHPTPRLRLAGQIEHVVRLCPEEFERK